MNHLCLYCEGKGIITKFPIRPPSPVVSTIQLPPKIAPLTRTTVRVVKKDGSLQPCIYYRALNSQTVKYSYLLPLVPAALE